MAAGSIKRYLLVFSGTVSLILGIAGIFIPLLPTTPFLLLSSFCYLRSSKRLYNWLINHRIFGSHISNYLLFKAVKRSTKLGALIFLWLALAVSIVIVNSIYVRVFLLAVGAGVTLHLGALKSLK